MEWIKLITRREVRPLFISVALISASVLMLEIGMIRVFSAMFESHHAFLLLSLAVLGLGFGGLFIHKRSQKTIITYGLDRLLPMSSALMGSSILIMTIILLETVGVRLNLIISGLAAIPAVLLMARAAPDKFNNRILAFVVAELIAVIILGSYQAILEPIPFANGTFKEMALLLS
jgi:hypothetical protein